MTTTLQIADRTITAEEIIPLLTTYDLIPQLLCEVIIDRAITSIHCTSEEIAQACQEFYQRWGLTSEAQKQAWQSQYTLSQTEVELLSIRRLRVEKFKQITWGHRLESYFLKRKERLDKVIYSLMRLSDRDLINELYYRILEGEQSFSELAYQYAQGAEAQTGGLVGPVELGTLSQHMIELLSYSTVGEVQPPIRMGDWYVLMRVEKLIPSKLDDAMRQRLLQEQFEIWFKDQLHCLSHNDKVWMGVF